MFDSTATDSLAAALADHDERIGRALDACAETYAELVDAGLRPDPIHHVPLALLMDAESSIVPAVEYFLAIATRFEV